VVAGLAAVGLVGIAACAPPPPPKPPPPPPPPPPPWAAQTKTTPNGYVSTYVGCASSLDAAGLDAFFRQRIGPVLGWDYQHVYPLGGDRYLWLFQDAFIDHSGRATTLVNVGFAQNIAMLQSGRCFTVFHRGTTAMPSSFEPGTGEVVNKHWWWPLGGQVNGQKIQVFWAEMVADPTQPPVGDGLPWHPVATWLATYDTRDLTRLSFTKAPNPGNKPLYGYAVASDDNFSYLFGNTYQQNLSLEGGFWSGVHSATAMWLARVPKGQLNTAPQYRADKGWTDDATKALPFLDRYWSENPMEARLIDGQWVASTKINGFWGDTFAIDTADHPWGPWTTVQEGPIAGRGGDPLLNTYNVEPLPWRASDGSLILSVSENAKNMPRDAYPHPERYRPTFRQVPFPS